MNIWTRFRSVAKKPFAVTLERRCRFNVEPKQGQKCLKMTEIGRFLCFYTLVLALLPQIT